MDRTIKMQLKAKADGNECKLKFLLTLARKDLYLTRQIPANCGFLLFISACKIRALSANCKQEPNNMNLSHSLKDFGPIKQ